MKIKKRVKEFKLVWYKDNTDPNKKHIYSLFSNNYQIRMNKETSIDISKKDKAEVLAALYNRSRPDEGVGLFYSDPTLMTKEEAAKFLKNTPDKTFDYIKGRVMKINLQDDILNTALYNRDVGQGVAEMVIIELPDKEDIEKQYSHIIRRLR